MPSTTERSPARRSGINAEIEYLRALAILLVLAMHGPLLCIPYPAGALERLQDWIHPATGVDLFFVISGYLMGRSFVAPWEAAEAADAARAQLVARAADFWVRRFYRLIPASALWLAIPFVACLVSGRTEIWLTPHAMFLKTIAGLLSLRNIEESQTMSFFGYYWSLSIENQFYAVLPLALLAVRPRWRVPGILAVCALNMVWRPGGEHWWLFRYDGLLYGLLLAALERSGISTLLIDCLPRSSGGRAAFLLVAGCALLTAPLVLIGNHPLAWAVVNWAGMALVLAASARLGVIAMPPGSRRMLLWIGARSYALYLCHIPVWFAVLDMSQRIHRDTPHDVPLRGLIAAGVSLAAADLTFRLVEQPMLKYGRRQARAMEERQAVLLHASSRPRAVTG